MKPKQFRHSPDMGEISGFGGVYEKACQDMLEAGCEWIAKQNRRDEIKIKQYISVFGYFECENDFTKRLKKQVAAAVPDCSGAMVQAVMMQLVYIGSNGWDAYCDLRRALVDEAKAWEEIKGSSNGFRYPEEKQR